MKTPKFLSGQVLHIHHSQSTYFTLTRSLCHLNKPLEKFREVSWLIENNSTTVTMLNSNVYRAITNLFHNNKHFLIKQKFQTDNCHLPYDFFCSSSLPDTVWQYHVMDNHHHIVAHAGKTNK